MPGYNTASGCAPQCNRYQNGTTYDANGNMLSDVGTSDAYTWDAFGKLRASAATGLTYSYDALGRRIHSEDTNGDGLNSTDIVYGPVGRLGYVQVGTGQLGIGKAAGVNVPLAGGGVLSLNLSGTHLARFDAVGAIRQMTNLVARTQSQHWSWGPFGERYGNNAHIEGQWSRTTQDIKLDMFDAFLPAQKRSVFPPYSGNNAPF
jgi:hypothetical protein